MRYPYLLFKVILFITLTTILNAKDAPYSYSYTPKFVYNNQVFPVTIFVKHYNPNDEPHFEFDIVNQLQPLDVKPTKLINKNSAYYTFYFKADTNDKELTIPPLSIWNLNYTYMLHPKNIKIKKLNGYSIENFSNLIASNLIVNRVKVDTYDSQNSLITIKLEATEANLEDIKIPKVTDDGIENIKRDGAKVTANYYFILPSTNTSIDFSYYNLIKNSFIIETISTKSRKNYTDAPTISPKDLSFDKIKMYILYSLIAIFLILVLFTKDILYIIIAATLIAFALYQYFQDSKVCIQEGAIVYVLPTLNSNISKQIEYQITTKSINRYRDFNKIEYKNIIGWVKDEDLCKN